MQTLHQQIGSKLINDPKKAFITELNENTDSFSFPSVDNLNYKDLKNALLMRYKRESETVNTDMGKQRKDFFKKIEILRERQENLIKRQKEVEKCVANFGKFVDEKETKRKRAMQRYQHELKLKLQKIYEHDNLLEELEILEKRRTKLRVTLEKHKKFKVFLTEVIAQYPDNSFETCKNKTEMLLNRYETLSDTNDILYWNLINNADHVKDLRFEYESLKLNHNTNKISLCNKLSELQRTRDQLKTKNNMIEQDLDKNGERYISEVLELANVFSSINNLSEKCLYKDSMPLKDMSVDDKLFTIQEFIKRKTSIIKTVSADEMNKHNLVH